MVERFLCQPEKKLGARGCVKFSNPYTYYPEWTKCILEYDRDGNVIGYRSNCEQGK